MTDELPPLPEPASWYCVSKYGMATLCVDEADALDVALTSDADWPLQAPHRAVQLVTVDQLRAAVLAERERCAKVCESDPDAVFAAIWNSLVIPGEFDAMDDTDKNRWRGVIMQAIGLTSEKCAAAIRAETKTPRGRSPRA